MRLFPKYSICHFYFLWPKIIYIIFAFKTVCCSRLFCNFYRFYFWLSVFHVYNVGSVFFLTNVFNGFVIIEWFDLNSNSNRFFQILFIKDFLNVFLMCLCILFISLKMLKSFLSELIIINTQLRPFSNAFYLSISLLVFLSACPNSSTSIASLFS